MIHYLEVDSTLIKEFIKPAKEKALFFAHHNIKHHAHNRNIPHTYNNRPSCITMHPFLVLLFLYFFVRLKSFRHTKLLIKQCVIYVTTFTHDLIDLKGPLYG